MPTSPASQPLSTAAPRPNAPQPGAPQPVSARPQWSLLLTGLLAGMLLSGSAALLWDRPEPPPIAIQLPPTAAPSVTLPTPTHTPAPVVVHVSGAVQHPGVYALPAGARVVDALAAAGGLLPDGDGVAVNQALLLWDQAQVYVPGIGESSPESSAVKPPPGLSGDTRSAPVAIPGVGAALINVNTATAAELETLPGIGPSKAAAIIANRPYASVDELDRVPGIGPATLEQVRDLVAAH